MFNYTITFAAHWYLLILVVLPPLWWFSYRRLAALGPVRRWLAIGLRSLLVVLLAVALAEIQTVRISDRLTVYFLMDQSLSIPEPHRQAMMFGPGYLGTVNSTTLISHKMCPNGQRRSRRRISSRGS